ncbi:beta-glucosidase [Euhalothece natronophila Z-M001]|uniref:beta-N-acetylhexosaminidase n=1 Tax=Euhalothece natronophila Z-M001 TaxID=522448 RepID=A0A5B8NQ42_9CHRO|nr:glycoside hydrolase family 3 N-terminal domain-containing protein [Euhalothece natronophila]QDZ40651.1 beta-glucosidase [Euhalothece natronophila Z-M001]
MATLPDYTQWQLEEQIAQMIVVRASGHLFDQQIRYPQWEPTNEKLRYWLESLNVGGVILLGGSAPEIAQRTQQLQGWAATPLLMAADIEEGVGQRFAGATWFPPPMALSGMGEEGKAYAAKMGELTAQEAIALGINWLFAPVVDVNNNPDNPVINVRAFGEDTQTVSELTTAFIDGAHRYPVLTTAKHFPGHGDTATDSHLSLPVLTVGADRLNEVELPPFKSAIAQGVDAVMSAHILVPAWDDVFPATLSSTALTQQLRFNLNFQGLIVTDALVMGALKEVASPEELPIFAIEAGADIILMPENPESAIAAIADAVNTGRLSRQRITASLSRIWEAKKKARITPPTENFIKELSTPLAEKTTTEILKASLQTHGQLPISQTGGRNLVIVDDLLHCDHIHENSSAIALPEKLGYELQLLGQTQMFPQSPEKFPLTLVQIFTRGNPFRGESGLNDSTKALLESLSHQNSLQAVIVYGSPYVGDWLEKTLPSNVPWLFSYGQMEKSSAIALQTLFGIT